MTEQQLRDWHREAVAALVRVLDKKISGSGQVAKIVWAAIGAGVEEIAEEALMEALSQLGKLTIDEMVNLLGQSRNGAPASDQVE